jgi:hypothetical protein
MLYEDRENKGYGNSSPVVTISRVAVLGGRGIFAPFFSAEYLPLSVCGVVGVVH